MRIWRTCILMLCFTFTAGLVSAQTEINACLQQTRNVSTPVDAWKKAKDYWASLTTPQATLERARLTTLRKHLVDLEAQKLELIAIVESHQAGARGSVAASAISTTEIPKIMERIEEILSELNILAERGDAFVGEKAFKDLKIQLSAKRAVTICNISDQLRSSTPNQETIRMLLVDLKAELQAISDADDQ